MNTYVDKEIEDKIAEKARLHAATYELPTFDSPSKKRLKMLLTPSWKQHAALPPKAPSVQDKHREQAKVNRLEWLRKLGRI